MASGVFDIIHPGHIFYLTQAKKLGTELLVVVACDATAKQQGKKPLFGERDRLALVQALKVVDRAVLGSANNHAKVVEKYKPDIIALGYDQFEKKTHISALLAQLSYHPRIERIPKYHGELAASRLIKAKAARQ